MTNAEKHQQEEYYRHLLYQIAKLANERKAIFNIYPDSVGWDKWSFTIEHNPSGKAWEIFYMSKLHWPTHEEACLAAFKKYMMLQPDTEAN